jgi:5'(3')-deoxyribonucleotidase
MTSDQSQIVLGVDLDGGCADFYGRMREVAAEWFECPVDELIQDVSYSLKEWGIKDADEYRSLAVTSRNLFGTVPMIPGTRKVLRRLSEEGYRIRIISDRLFIDFVHAMAVQQTIDWLDHHGIPYRDLCFMKDKDQVGANIYIEDNPHNIERLRNQGHYTICFASSTNADLAAPRAKDWEEVYKLVTEWKRAGVPDQVAVYCGSAVPSAALAADARAASL